LWLQVCVGFEVFIHFMSNAALRLVAKAAAAATRSLLKQLRVYCAGKTAFDLRRAVHDV
jgi:hypothetical protein